jgi:transcriptional regulator with PAS, ATPase and Fis domain
VKNSVEKFIGVSEAVKTIRAEIQYAARSSVKVLLTGESGVGKEVAAHLIHELSERADATFVPINCGGVSETLLESELFGHVRGSFTGAHRDRLGLLELANRGTVFMDEVSEMGQRMQALLLRFLESGEIHRVGSDRGQQRLDVRVVAATNRDLQDRVTANTFREDLYYRLNVIEIVIPPLRSRPEDIPVLFEHFLKLCSHQHGVAPPRITADATAALVDYDWPGNVRQVRNVVERLMARQPGAVVSAADLPRRNVARLNGTETASPDPAFGSVVDRLFNRMVKQGEPFWSVVYPSYMFRDLTRSELRAIVARGLEATGGSYKMLIQLFNMDTGDYKRFLNFLRKQQCQVPYERFRAVGARHRGLPEAQFIDAHAEKRGLAH